MHYDHTSSLFVCLLFAARGYFTHVKTVIMIMLIWTKHSSKSEDLSLNKTEIKVYDLSPFLPVYPLPPILIYISLRMGTAYIRLSLEIIIKNQETNSVLVTLHTVQHLHSLEITSRKYLPLQTSNVYNFERST